MLNIFSIYLLKFDNTCRRILSRPTLTTKIGNRHLHDRMNRGILDRMFFKDRISAIIKSVPFAVLKPQIEMKRMQTVPFHANQDTGDHMNDKIIIRGARQHNLKISMLNCPATNSLFSPVYPVRVNRRWPSIPSMRKDKGAMSSPYPPMPGNFLVKWRNRMSI